MRTLSIAIWALIPSGEVLLQQKIYRKEKKTIIYYQPLKEWVSPKERVAAAIRGVIKKNFDFNFNFLKLHFNLIEKENFVIPGKGVAVRYHFLVEIPFQTDIRKQEIRFVGIHDLPKIGKIKNFNQRKKEIFLFNEDYKVLKAIFGIKGEANLTDFLFSVFAFFI